MYWYLTVSGSRQRHGTESSFCPHTRVSFSAALLPSVFSLLLRCDVLLLHLACAPPLGGSCTYTPGNEAVSGSGWLAAGRRPDASLSLTPAVSVYMARRQGICLGKEGALEDLLVELYSTAAMKRCLNICPIAAKVHQHSLSAN